VRKNPTNGQFLAAGAAINMNIPGRTITYTTDTDWIPGDSGAIVNTNYQTNPTPADLGLEAENIIYLGANEWWGHFGGDKQTQIYDAWFAMVKR
jgi:hypothetical protein